MRFWLFRRRDDAQRLEVVVPHHVMAEAQQAVGDVPAEARRFPPIGGDVLAKLPVVVVDREEGVALLVITTGKVSVFLRRPGP